MPFIEARELAHEIVEAPRRGKQRAQREIEQRGGRSRPEHEREMREIAALDEGAEKIGHRGIVELKVRGGATQPRRPPLTPARRGPQSFRNARLVCARMNEHATQPGGRIFVLTGAVINARPDTGRRARRRCDPSIGARAG